MVPPSPPGVSSPVQDEVAVPVEGRRRRRVHQREVTVLIADLPASLHHGCHVSSANAALGLMMGRWGEPSGRGDIPPAAVHHRLHLRNLA